MDETIMTMIIHFHTYKARIARGEVRPLCWDKVFFFQGMDQMLLIMDDIMDEVNFQQNGTEHRRVFEGKRNYQFLSLEGESEEENKEDESLETGIFVCEKEDDKNKHRQVTVTVRILYRRHASMQGTLMIRGKRVSFRSALELIRMMHEYVESVY